MVPTPAGRRRRSAGPGGLTPTERAKLMRRLASLVLDFLRKEDGPTAVEYAVMLALIILVCFAAIGVVGTASSANFNSPKIGSALQSTGS